MNNHFLPSFHTSFSASEKLTAAWCDEAMKWYYYNNNNQSLLHDKNVVEIKEYASGKFDMTPYKMMFKSLKKSLDKKNQNSQRFMDTDTTGIDWSCFSAIPPKVNSAISIIQKIPIEISCIALDPLAIKKKEEDIAFLKNKPLIEADLQEIADNLDIGKVDLGTTKYSSVPYSDSPYGFDLNDDEELDIFRNLLYSLDIEASFEVALQIFWELKKVNQVRLLETKDQFHWGVSVNRVFENSLTGLPDVEYVNPYNLEAPKSELPDFSDNTHRFINRRVTAMEVFNYFSDEIGDKGNLYSIINAEKEGYCACNNYPKSTKIPYSQFDSFKMDLVYCEIKSVDWVGISQNKKSKRGFRSLTADKDKASEKLWGQNTYCFWWLKNTKYYFKIDRLDYAHRELGHEAYQTFSTNIYKSQERSCVENCIGENKNAQIAHIKLQHALIKSLPAGKYIDLRFLRGTLEALKQEGNDYTIESLLNLIFENNIMLGDTEGFDGKNDGQFKPFMDIAGGLKTEINGYLQIIQDANRNIEAFSGINQALTGQAAPNPDMLVGVQRLQLNASLNALYYATEAIQTQCQKIGYLMANHIKQAIEAGGERKKYIINLIGSQRANIIDGLSDLPLHDIGVKITVNQREEERAKFEQTMYQLKAQGVVSAADEFLLSGISNPRDKYRLLAIKEKQFMKRQEKMRAEQAQQQQAMIAQQGENQQAAIAATTDSKIKQIFSKGEVEAKIISLANQLGINATQFKALVDRQLMVDRQRGQVQKSISTLEKKAELENQKSYI